MRGFLLAFLLLPELAHGASLVRGPYLQTTTETSVIIVWRTEAPTRSVVRYGRSPDALTEVRQGQAERAQHEVRLLGLMPGERYHYSVGTPEETLASGEHCTFKTAPQIGSSTPTRIWVVGDSGTGEAKQARVRDAMLQVAGARKPDLFLHVGDMAYSSGEEGEFQEKFFEMYPAVLRSTAVWPAIGNHEGKESDSLIERGPYYDGYVLPRAGQAGGLPSGTEAYYAFDWANIHFIALESQHSELRRAQGAMLAWLQMDLAATDQEWIVVFFHHPPYTKGSHDSDLEIAHVEIRERALPIMEAAGVDLVIGGHSHIYERSYLSYGAYDTPTKAEGFIVDHGDGKPSGDGPYHKLGEGHPDATMFLVAGHGGTNVGQDGDQDHPLMYFTEVRNGSLLIDVKGPTLELRNVRIDGRVTDSFTIVKERGLRLLGPLSGALVQRADALKLEWTGAAIGPQVDIELSRGGEPWERIATATSAPSGGRYTLKAPDETGSVRLRVSDGVVSDERPIELVRVPPMEVFAMGSSWRFSAQPQEGLAWTQPDFPDRSWESGKGKFGVCACLPWDSGAETFVADALLEPAVHFRKDFELARLPGRATLRLIHEIGATVYINGQEVWERSGGISTAYTELELQLEDGPFVVGQNTVAVKVEKSEANGASLSFDMALWVTPKEEGCACTGARPTEGRGVGLVLGCLLALLGFRRR